MLILAQNRAHKDRNGAQSTNMPPICPVEGPNWGPYGGHRGQIAPVFEFGHPPRKILDPPLNTSGMMTIVTGRKNSIVLNKLGRGVRAQGKPLANGSAVGLMWSNVQCRTRKLICCKQRHMSWQVNISSAGAKHLIFLWIM